MSLYDKLVPGVRPLSVIREQESGRDVRENILGSLGERSFFFQGA